MNVVESIEKWLMDNPDGCNEKIDQVLLDEAVEEFSNALEKSFLLPNSRSNNVSASGAGKCVRQLAYKYHEYEPEPFSPRTRVNLFMGHVYELLVVFLAQMAGVPIENQQKEVDVNGLPGSMDFTVGPVVYDVKSKTSFGFDAENKEGITNFFGEATQGAIYCEGEGSKEFRHLNVNKQTGAMAEVSMVPNPADVKKALERKAAVEASTPDNLPPREHRPLLKKKTGEQYLDIPCVYCSFKGHCWDISEVRHVSKTYFQHFVKGEKN